MEKSVKISEFYLLPLKFRDLISELQKKIFHNQSDDLELTKIRIKNNWDQFPTDKKNDESVYVGRKNELDHVKHWINNSKSGSLLISGVRGVGKTSFVYKAIYEAKKSNGSIKIVEINGSTLNDENQLDLIQKIIESLYYLDKKNIKSLRELAQASEANEGESSQSKHSYNLATTLSIPIQVLTIFFFFILNLVNWQSTGFGQYIFNILPREYDIYINLISSLLLGKIVGEIAIKFSREGKTQKHKEFKIETNNVVYLKNLLIENLSRGTRFGHKFSKNKYVFVIDELDKLEKFEKFEKVVKSIKTLITISEAQFIFISDDKLHSHLKSKILPEDPYPMSSTYFNWEIFLSPLNSSDIADFIKELSLKTFNKKQEYKVDAISLYVYSQTAGIPSKIKSILRDFINYSENKNAYIDLNHLDKNKLKIARITKLYERTIQNFDSNEYSKQRLNHDRREILFPIFKKIISPGTSFNGDKFINNLIDDSKNPAKESFLPDSDEYGLLEEEIIQIFSDINDNANINYKLSNPLITKSSPVNFSLDKSQITPGITDLKEKQGPTNLEMDLKEKLIVLVENLKKVKLKLGIINDSRMLSIIDYEKDFNPTYDSIHSIVKSINANESLDQANIKDRLVEVEEINDKLNQDFGSLIVNYFKPVLNFAYQTSNSKKIVKFVRNNKSKTFKLDTQSIKSVDDITKKIKNILSNFKEGSEFSYSASWEAKQIDANKPWRFDAHELSIKNDSEFRTLIFQVRPMTSYWRIGLALGREAGEIKKLGDDDQYTLFHFHKDKASNYLKYKRFKRVKDDIEVHEPLDIDGVKNIPPNSNLVIQINATGNPKESFIDISINNYNVDRFNVYKTDLKSASIVVWTDNYKITEPIVIETIIFETKTLKKKRKVQK